VMPYLFAPELTVAEGVYFYSKMWMCIEKMSSFLSRLWV